MPERRALCAASLERHRVPWLRLFIGCSVLLLWGSTALAHTVALLRPPNPSARAAELLQRLRGELLSVGFEVAIRDRPREPNVLGSEPWQRVLATETEVDAAVVVVGEAVAVDVWLIDSARHFQLVTRVHLDPSGENAAKGLAIRTSEVLRARLFETRVEIAQPPAPATAAAPATPAFEGNAESTPQFRRVGLELGAAALASLDGVGPAFLPMLRIDWAIESKLLLQATLAGLGTRPNVATAAGTAEVAMQYGLLGACYRLSGEHPVRPLVALSFGALRTAVVGEADLPRAGHSVEQWSFLVDASLGAAFQLSRQYNLVLAGHAQFAQPYVAIHFGDQQVAAVGRPNLLLSLTFGAWL